MSQHTPGPWTAYQKQGEQGTPLPQWRIHGPGICGPIATVDFDLTQGTCAKQNANVAANAALIAAAPSMYEALKRLHEHARTVDAAYRNGLNDTDKLYQAVDEALRLAEGGKP